MKTCFLSVALVFAFALPLLQAQTLQDYLNESQFAQGIADYEQRVAQPSANNEQRFSLAALELIVGIEGLSQDLYRLGLTSDFLGQAGLFSPSSLPAGRNPNPEVATAEAISESLNRFAQQVAKANKALQTLDESEFSLSINFPRVRLDLNGDGQASSFETLSSLLEVDYEDIDWDQSDALWLKGYTHLLLALTNTLLAHDWRQVYEKSAHLFFQQVNTQWARTINHQALQFELSYSNNDFWGLIADFVAGVHQIRLPVTDQERLKRAHGHMLSAVSNSRVMWESILAETDNQTEWIPNPQQTGIDGAQIPQAMVDGWMEVLSESEQVLKGEKLLPHWRIPRPKGINLKKVFHEPQDLDLILWIQGSAALPYLEEGEISDSATWNNLSEAFQGNFANFSLWVN